jgi:hypothetical protein
MTDHNKSVEDLASSIDRLALEFLLPIQTSPNVNQTMFDVLYQSTKELTDALKGTPNVPQILVTHAILDHCYHEGGDSVSEERQSTA